MVEKGPLLIDQSILEFEEYNFEALEKALENEPEDIISELKDSGLKGRGGAGFPTGVKWEIAADQESSQKHMICNAAEGEVGTFKDRYLLENNPLKVLEGFIIAAYTVGADKGYIYIRGEYTKPINILEEKLEQLREHNLLGKNINGSGFDLEVKMIREAEAYVCGEETSLINSLEGKRGKSRIKPPYPVVEGLFDEPTVVNNVETLATAAEVIKMGADKYSSLGAGESKGTKLISISGDINEPGVYEVEFGEVTIREIIEDYAGGVTNNKEVKFVVPGGISTSILDAKELDIPYTYESLAEKGTGIGSGAMIVVAEGRDLVDLMLNAAHFFKEETCGTCFPCREGNRQIYHLLEERNQNGGFTKRDFQLVKDIGETINLAARCGLGKASMNFIGSVVDNYGDELVRGNK